MKKLVLALVLTATAQAGLFGAMPTENSTWSEIRNDFARVVFNEPSVKLDNGPMTSAFFVCKDGDVLRTKKQLDKCVDWTRRRDDRVCTEYKKYWGIAAIEGTRTRCTKWERSRDKDSICVAWEDYNYTLPLSHEINIHKRRHVGGDRDRSAEFGRKLFTKTLHIEDCE